MAHFDLYASLGFLLVNTAFQAKQALAALFQQEGFDTTVDQFVVMGALIRTQNITQKQICQISCKNQSNLTRILKEMERRGLIHRETGTDARSRNVSLSEKGRALYLDLAPIAERYMGQILGDLPQAQQDTLTNILLHIREKI